jgi:hypothetical protein
MLAVRPGRIPCCLMARFPVRTGGITGIVSFAYSLTDAGNLYAATGQPPARYDQGRFTSVTTSAIGVGVLGGQGYLFWDLIHPTTVGHQVLADVAAASVVTRFDDLDDERPGRVVRRLDATARSARLNRRDRRPQSCGWQFRQAGQLQA